MRGILLIAAALAAATLLPGGATAAVRANPWQYAAAPALAEEPVLAPAQMLDRSREAMKRVEAIAAEVEEALADARDDKDVLRSNCLGELHSQSAALRKAGKEALASLEEAVEANDADAAARLHSRIEATRRHAEKIRTAARECVGASAGGDDRSRTDLLSDPDLDDPTDPAQPPPPVVRPPAASPTN